MSVDPEVLDLTPLLGPERTVFLDLLRGLTAVDWERPTECPAWDVKGIALHLLGDDLSLLTRERDASTDSLTLYAMDHPGLTFNELLNGFNDRWVATAHFFSTELVIDLLQAVGDWSDTFYCSVGLETISREPVGFFAADGPSPYWQVIAREYVERIVHQSQIRRATGAPELEGELIAMAARVVVHALAAWMRDYAPAAGSTIVVDYGAAGSWTYRRESDRWSVTDGAIATPTARITIAPERVVAVLARGVTLEEAVESITISGDDALARGALDIITPIVGRPS